MTTRSDTPSSQKRLIILGAGGHGRMCAEIASLSGQYGVISFSDPAVPIGHPVGQWSNDLRDEDLRDVLDEHTHLFIGLGQVGTGISRQRLFERTESLTSNVPVIVSPVAFLSASATVGKGSLVGHHAVVNTSARIGSNCILNTHAIVEHDCTVGPHVHVSTGAIINGGSVIGARSFIGSNATINHDLEIGEDVIVGSGAIVISDITVPGVYVGVPARRVDDGAR